MAPANNRGAAAALAIDRELLRQVHLFPVRHHSPRASAALRAFLDARAPQVVLVEGPADAAGLIDVLLDAGTVPPVAILAYRTDDTPDSALWPFAAYSPEYVALRWAAEHGAAARFIDLPAGQALAAHGSALREVTESEGAATQGDGPGEAQPDQRAASVEERCAAAYGYRSFEEFWEAQFEAPDHDPERFREALCAYADLVRAQHVRRYDQAREVLMARGIAQVVASGVPAERVAVVLGAAHVAALLVGELDEAAEAELPAAVPCALTLIPYSFPRLAAQLGYGAGNRAPLYYQRAHDAGCDFRRAALEVLVEFSAHLRERGFSASLADTIEAYRLAVALSDLRGKSGPGLDELREAAIAALCRGEAEHVDELLWRSIAGERVGSVAARIGKNSLQEEFWREVRERRLPQGDSSQAQRFHLHLEDEVQRGTSVFLHRLRLSGVPYASYQGSNVLGGGARRRDDESEGGMDALLRRRETWKAGWRPETETALVERIVLGDTLEQVASRELHKRLSAARGTGAAAEVLAEAVLVRSATLPAEALQRCEVLAAADDDVVSLAAATRVLAGLASFGVTRLAARDPSAAQGEDQGEVIPRLGERLFLRAALRAPTACQGNDEAVVPVLGALRTLHDVALGPFLAQREVWIDAARGIAHSTAVHPRCAGFTCALLFQAQLLDEAQVTREVGQRLSGVSDPRLASLFLEGFFAVNAALLTRSRAVVQALDSFLCQIPAERFRQVLPLLRRAFAALGTTERRYLLESLIALRGLHDKKHEARAVLRERDQQALKAMSADLGKVMDDLDDLL